MIELSPEKIKEIAQELGSGFRAFMHKKTGQLSFMPDDDFLMDVDIEEWKKEIKEFKKIVKNKNEYFEFEKWTSSEAFEAMSEFADQVDDFRLKGRLFYALGKKKPFSEFKFVIDNSGPYRQLWFKFRDNWQEEYVKKQLDYFNSPNE